MRAMNCEQRAEVYDVVSKEEHQNASRNCFLSAAAAEQIIHGDCTTSMHKPKTHVSIVEYNVSVSSDTATTTRYQIDTQRTTCCSGNTNTHVHGSFKYSMGSANADSTATSVEARSSSSATTTVVATSLIVTFTFKYKRNTR